MIRCADPTELTRQCDLWRKHGLRVGLVPTMGYLHEGHLSLMRLARQHADRVVVTLFVNPTQFGPNEDLTRYPRDLEGDARKCEVEQVDMLFAPSSDAMYPAGHQSVVDVLEVSRGLCGGRRPGHFRGVCTVVAMLFNLTGRCCAIFGEKDFQQLQVIDQMVRDLRFPVKIISAPIVREHDGIAMSSRNVYLDPEQRNAARSLNQALQAARLAVAGGARSAGELVANARQRIEAEPLARIDYVELRRRHDLAPIDTVEPDQTVMLVAAFFGNTRLIDNLVL